MSKTFKISLHGLFSSMERSCWLEEQQLVSWIFLKIILGVGAFSPPLLPLPSRFAVLAFLRLGRDSPNSSVLCLPMFAAFRDGHCYKLPVLWLLFQEVACAIALPKLYKSLSLGETFYSCNMWKAGLVWKLGRQKASTRGKVCSLGVGCSRTGRVHLASAAFGSFQKAAGARSTPGWLNSPRL